MSDPRCETCRYWTDTATGKGLCRRYPPRWADNCHPMTYPEAWCGEWRAREADQAAMEADIKRHADKVMADLYARYDV